MIVNSIIKEAHEIAGKGFVKTVHDIEGGSSPVKVKHFELWIRKISKCSNTFDSKSSDNISERM